MTVKIIFFFMILLANTVLTSQLYLYWQSFKVFVENQLHWIVSYYFTGRKWWSTSPPYSSSGKHADLWKCEYWFSLSLHRKKNMLKKALFYFENVLVKSYSATYKCFTGDRDLPLLMCFIGASSVQILKGMQCKLKTTYLHLTVSSQVTDSSTHQCQLADIKLSREVGELVFNPAQLTY